MKNVKISVDKKLKDSDYYSVGNYKVTISYKNQKEVVKYKVVDTTAPVITGVESIDIVQGIDLSAYDFASLFTVSDLAKVETEFDTSAIDSNVINSYTLKVIVKDESKNETVKEVAVNIVQAPSLDEEIVSETVTNADGSTSVKTVTKKKATVESNSNSSSSSNNISNSKSSSSNTSSNSTSNNNSSTARPNNSSSNTNTNTNKPDNGGSSNNSSSSSGNFESGSTSNGDYTDIWGGGTGNWHWDENGNLVID